MPIVPSKAFTLLFLRFAHVLYIKKLLFSLEQICHNKQRKKTLRCVVSSVIDLNFVVRLLWSNRSFLPAGLAPFFHISLHAQKKTGVIHPVNAEFPVTNTVTFQTSCILFVRLVWMLLSNELQRANITRSSAETPQQLSKTQKFKNT